MASGALTGIVLGDRLGEIRTGAIGGLAIDAMAPREAARIGIIGSGRQARTQLQAAAAIRALRQIKVYSRDDHNRAAFAREMTEALGLAVEAVESAQEAVADSDIAICATDSAEPVVKAKWLKPGAHINTIGPKQRDGHEIGMDIVAKSMIIATDSPDQAQAYDPPFFLAGTPDMED